MLSRAMVGNGLYESGRIRPGSTPSRTTIAIAQPALSTRVHQSDPAVSGFQAVTLEACLGAYKAIGDEEAAQALHERYLDFGKIEAVIFG